MGEKLDDVFIENHEDVEEKLIFSQNWKKCHEPLEQVLTYCRAIDPHIALTFVLWVMGER